VSAAQAYEPYRKCIIAQVKSPNQANPKEKLAAAKQACTTTKQGVEGDMSILAAGELAEAEATVAGPLIKKLTDDQRDALIQEVIAARIQFLDEGLDGQAAWEAEH
jgi:hypothetical protein